MRWRRRGGKGCVRGRIGGGFWAAGWFGTACGWTRDAYHRTALSEARGSALRAAFVWGLRTSVCGPGDPATAKGAHRPESECRVDPIWCPHEQPGLKLWTQLPIVGQAAPGAPQVSNVQGLPSTQSLAVLQKPSMSGWLQEYEPGPLQ